MKPPSSPISRRRLLTLASLSVSATPCFGVLPSIARAATGEKIKHKACIVLFMEGGPSHIDTFDPKPDAPDGCGGPLKPISTSLPGVHVTELFPHLAERMQDISIIRGMSTPAKEHSRAQFLLRTGRLPTPAVNFPSLGSVASIELGEPNFSLPKFVMLGRRIQRNAGNTSGYLGPQYEPLGVMSEKIDRGSPTTTVARFNSRLELLNDLEREFQKQRETELADAHRTLVRRSVEMMRSEHLSAFDISGEPAQIQSAYGDSDFGRNCLRARRLVETGVPFVEVVLPMWDHHSAMYTSKTEGIHLKAAQADAAMSALMDDLSDRGMLDSTLIVWTGEFGRTPKLRPLPGGGREHYSKAWTTLLAGGGLRNGQVIGRTDASGAEVVDRPVGAADFLATICLAIGIDPYKKLPGPNGRPLPIIDNQTQTPKPLVEVLG